MLHGIQLMPLFCYCVWHVTSKVTLLQHTIDSTLVDIYRCTAQTSTACFINRTQPFVTIACRNFRRLSLEQIRVGYAVDSCVQTLDCPLQPLETRNEYYTFILHRCNRRQSCTISSDTLHTRFANKFAQCPHSGKVRNIVEVSYSCVRGKKLVEFRYCSKLVLLPLVLP